jgi:excisionase family DNA binding protein
MPQDFYTLDEAAKFLNVPKEQLLELSRKGDLRAFLDRGTQRFRRQEIDELARKMGIGSAPDLQPQGAHPASSDVFAFDLAPPEGASGVLKSGSGVKKPGSDSDVRLVPQGSDVELQAQPAKSPSSSVLGKSSSKVSADKDSDVKLVEDDSAVPIGREKGTGESGVRLEGGSGRMLDSGVRLVEDRPRRGAPADSGLLTEELDLDAELRQAEKAAKPPSSKKVIPFELSKDAKAPRKEPTPSSSEFELKPSKANEPSDSVFDSSSEQIRLDPEDDSSIHVSASRDLGLGGASGINLNRPSDKGLSLEKELSDSSGETLALDLSPEAKKPAKKSAKEEADSSSEFELTLDDDIGLAPMDEDKGSKDVFQTNLGAKPGKKGGDSSGDISLQPEGSGDIAETSDFELALDEDSSAVESETGSEVIVIDEDAGEADATALRPDDLEVDDVGEIIEASDEELAVEAAADEDEVSPARRVAAVEAAPAEWGIWGAVHILTIIVLVPTGFLLFEMLRSIWGYGKDTPVAGKMFDIISGMMK